MAIFQVYLTKTTPLAIQIQVWIYIHHYRASFFQFAVFFFFFSFKIDICPKGALCCGTGCFPLIQSYYPRTSLLIPPWLPWTAIGMGAWFRIVSGCVLARLCSRNVAYIDSAKTKSGVFKDERDTIRRRVRHRDGRLLKGGIGLTTGLGWSDRCVDTCLVVYIL